MRDSEAPMTREVDSPVSDTVTTHPAFGSIQASRVQGSGTILYGSDFDHQHFVVIRINRSELHRGLSNDHYHSRDQLISVALSEAQWATFVSSLNSGDTPCTIEHIDRKRIPSIERGKPVAEKFADEMHQTLREIQDALQALADDKRLPQWAKKDIGMQARRLTSSTGFIAEQFSEHMENTVEKAKVEVNAYATAVIHRAGLDAIAGGQAIISLPNTKDKANE